MEIHLRSAFYLELYILDLAVAVVKAYLQGSVLTGQNNRIGIQVCRSRKTERIAKHLVCGLCPRDIGGKYIRIGGALRGESGKRRLLVPGDSEKDEPVFRRRQQPSDSQTAACQVLLALIDISSRTGSLLSEHVDFGRMCRCVQILWSPCPGLKRQIEPYLQRGLREFGPLFA